jgi:cytochrome c6
MTEAKTPRVLILLVIVALAVAALLAGCGGSGGTTTVATEVPPSAEEAAEEATEKEAEEEAAEAASAEGEAAEEESPKEEPAEEGGEPEGGASAAMLAEGKTVFTTNCGSCHTLKEAGTSGTIGPNLDELEPSESTVEQQVINGGGPMPAFGNEGILKPEEIKAVATYVSSVAGTE